MSYRGGACLLVCCGLLWNCGGRGPESAKGTAAATQQMRYRLTLLPEGFVPVAIDPKGRVAGFTPQEAAIYEPATRALTTSLVPRIGPNDISVANAMNVQGDIAGAAMINGSGLLPFVRRADGRFQVLRSAHGVPLSGEASAIDASGVVYGAIGTMGSSSTSLFSYEGGPDMTLFGDGYDQIRAVSPSGLLVGCRFSAGDSSIGQPVVFRNRASVSISPSLRGCLTAVNDAGVAVGGFRTANEIGAYLWDGSIARTLPMEVANSISADGKVGGAVVVERIQSGTGSSTFSTHAALWLGDLGAQDLNAIVDVPMGLELIAAVAINDTGWIVGTTSQGGAFLLTPR